jgi:hypothetical protein
LILEVNNEDMTQHWCLKEDDIFGPQWVRQPVVYQVNSRGEPALLEFNISERRLDAFDRLYVQCHFHDGSRVSLSAGDLQIEFPGPRSILREEKLRMFMLLIDAYLLQNKSVEMSGHERANIMSLLAESLAPAAASLANKLRNSSPAFKASYLRSAKHKKRTMHMILRLRQILERLDQISVAGEVPEGPWRQLSREQHLQDVERTQNFREMMSTDLRNPKALDRLIDNATSKQRLP